MYTKREKRNLRKYLITMAIAILPEIIFAIIVGNLIDIAIWKAWLCIQGISILITGSRESMEYLVFRLVWRNDMIDDTSESLSIHGYPNPKNYPDYNLPEYYFYNVMQDDMLEISTRLDAAYALGTIDPHQGLLKKLRISSVMSDAIEKYHRIKFGGSDFNEELGEYI